MTQANPPILATREYLSGDIRFTMEAHDLDSPPQVRVIRPGEPDLFLPGDIALALADHAPSMASESRRARDLFMREANSPDRLTDTELRPWRGGHAFALPDLAERDGYPCIYWVGETRERKAGWALGLQGVHGYEDLLMFAEWDDTEAIRGFVETLADRETLFTMSGITHPEPTARLTARLEMDRLVRTKALPRLNMPGLRKILRNAGIDPRHRFMDPVLHARLRILKVYGADQAIPVAVAIRPPEFPRFGDLPENELPEGRVKRRALWISQVLQALEGTKWRPIDLPQPVPDPRIGHNLEVFWVTMLTPELASTIAPLLRVEAEILGMHGAVKVL